MKTLLLMLASLPAFAQYSRPILYEPTDPPSSTCSVQSNFWNNWTNGNVWKCIGASGVNNGTWTLLSSGGSAFGSITSGTNTSATMTVGSGAQLTYTGTGIINATKILGTTLTSLNGLGFWTSGVPSALSVGTGLSNSGGSLSVNQSVILSRATNQGGVDTYCRSQNGTTAYTCTLTPTLTAYTTPSSTPAGMTCVVLLPDVGNSTTATLAIDGLAAVNIVARDGSALASGAIVGNQPLSLCNNGSAWVIVGDGVGSGGGAAGAYTFSLSSPAITVGGNCTSSLTTNPCLLKSGTNVISITSSFVGTVTGGTGAGNLYIYTDSSGTQHVDYSGGVSAVTCSGCSSSAAGSPVFPNFTYPVLSCTTSGTTITACTNDQAVMNMGPSITCGSNMSCTYGSGGSVSLSSTGGGSSGQSYGMGLNFATLPHPGSFYSFPSNNTFGASGGGLPTTTACTFQNLRVFVPGTVNAGGNVVMVWRDDTAGTDSSITVTAAAGSASQWYSDLTHTLTATLNHQYNLKLTNNSTADLSGNWSWAIQCN